LNDPSCAGAAFGELEAEADADVALALAELNCDTDETEADEAEAEGAVAVLEAEALLADTVATEVEDSDATEVSLTLAVLDPVARVVMTVNERVRVTDGMPEEMEGGPTVGRGITVAVEVSETSRGLAIAAPEAMSKRTPEKAVALMVIQ